MIKRKTNLNFVRIMCLIVIGTAIALGGLFIGSMFILVPK